MWSESVPGTSMRLVMLSFLSYCISFFFFLFFAVEQIRLPTFFFFFCKALLKCNHVHLFMNFSCCCWAVKSCPTLCDPMDCSTPDFPIFYHLLEFAQTHAHWIGDAIQSSHLLLFPSPAFSLSQHQGLSQWVSSSHQVELSMVIFSL